MSAAPIYSYLWMTFAIAWIVARLATKETLEKADIGSRLLYGIPVVLGFYLLFGGMRSLAWLSYQIIPANKLFDGLGVVTTAAGIALAIWARFHIGQNWSGTPTVKVGHELIRTGPYAWVRHPIYSGLLLAALGTAIGKAQLRGFVGLVIIAVGLWIKTRIEERFMSKTFGSEYDEYRRSTGALVPRLRA